MNKRCVFVLAAFLSGAAGAQATERFESAYTELDTRMCAHFPGKEAEDYGSWRCKGHAGITVRVSASDQRMFMSFGGDAADQPAASQTFPNFNNVYKARIEWRLLKEPKRKPAPFAAIVRWNVKIDEDNKPSRGRVLVVTKLGEQVCHVGYVDALANKNANALAREIADRHARGFDCGKDKRIILGERRESIAGMAEAIEQEAGKKASPSSPASGR